MPADAIAIDHRTMLGSRYAIINPLQVDASVWDDLPVRPIVPAAFLAHPELFPVLLALDELGNRARVGLLDRMAMWECTSTYPYFSALLSSDAAADRVERHLASLMVHQHHGIADVLRPHDPRVFRHMQWLLDDDQKDAMLGPITGWTWREPSGAWQQMRRQRVPAAALHLRQAQWDAYARIGLLNRALAQLQGVVPGYGNDATDAASVDSLLETALAMHHLVDPDDRCLFAEQAVRFHPRIHAHSALVSRLLQANTGQTSYVSACADLDDAAMRRFAHDMDQQRTERIAS